MSRHTVLIRDENQAYEVEIMYQHATPEDHAEWELISAWDVYTGKFAFQSGIKHMPIWAIRQIDNYVSQYETNHLRTFREIKQAKIADGTW